MNHHVSAEKINPTTIYQIATSQPNEKDTSWAWACVGFFCKGVKVWLIEQNHQPLKHADPPVNFINILRA